MMFKKTYEHLFLSGILENNWISELNGKSEVLVACMIISGCLQDHKNNCAGVLSNQFGEQICLSR